MKDEKTDDYLFDPAAPPDQEVVRLEAALAPLRYDSDSHPLPEQRRVVRRRSRMLLAAAAMFIAFVAAAALWLWTWPSDRPWSVVAGPFDSLPIGKTVSTGSDDSLLVRVARIGWMRIGRDSEVTLLSTRSNQHRLVMQEGTLHVSVWAPPRSIAVRTPSGEVIDFGCEFVVRVHPAVTSVDVVSGWVRLDNGSGEVLVPGGASSVMRRDDLPSVPLFRSATAGFSSAIRLLEEGSEPRAPALATVLREARRRDVLTLLSLAGRDATAREVLLLRAAELMPPRSPQTLVRARAGDEKAVAAWIDELPLPPRNWVPNWRDRLPFRVR